MDLITQIQNLSKNSEPQQKQIPLAQSQQYLKNSQKSSKGQNTQLQKLLGTILDGQIDEIQRDKNPELVRVKNNLLLILLVLSAYGVYYLIGEFLDVLLLAYIAGIAFYQSRQKFIYYIINPSSYQGTSQSKQKRTLKVLACLLIGFILPRIRYIVRHPHKFQNFLTLHEYIKSIQVTNSIIVIFCQIMLGLYIIHLIFGPSLKKLLGRIRPNNHNFVKILFAIFITLGLVAIVIVIPTVFFREISNVGRIIERKVQNQLGCSILSFDQNDTLPLCSEKLTTQNQFLRSTVKQFQQQNKTLQQCLIFLQNIQEQYLGEYITKYEFINKNIFYYDQVACTWYSFIQKAIAYSGIQISPGADQLHSVFSTGTSLFKIFFGNLTWILSSISNSLFSLTTFLTAFILTISSYSSSSTFRQLFSQNKQQLINSITSLIQATFFIAMEHLLLSFLLLELFSLTPINLVISTMLSSMALFPFFRPWLGVLAIAGIRMAVLGEYWVSGVFVVLYYWVSQWIYSKHYRKMELNQIVTNMSVLFGIYRFGVAGVVYGPLIVITYRCVQRELFRGYEERKSRWSKDTVRSFDATGQKQKEKENNMGEIKVQSKKSN